jgi:hypothetical protein
MSADSGEGEDEFLSAVVGAPQRPDNIDAGSDAGDADAQSEASADEASLVGEEPAAPLAAMKRPELIAMARARLTGEPAFMGGGRAIGRARKADLVAALEAVRRPAAPKRRRREQPSHSTDKLAESMTEFVVVLGGALQVLSQATSGVTGMQLENYPERLRDPATYQATMSVMADIAQTESADSPLMQYASSPWVRLGAIMAAAAAASSKKVVPLEALPPPIQPL